MMAGLPEEVRNRVMAPLNDSDEPLWLSTAYREVYGVNNFQTNPYLDYRLWDYSRCLESLTLPDVIIILDELIQEKEHG